MLTTLLCRAALAIAGHRLCCRIPSWTAHVGQRWDTYDVAPWNLYNLIWRFRQWAEARADDRR